MIHFPSPCWELRKGTYSENPVKFLKANFTVMQGPSYNWILLPFLSLEVVPVELPATCRLQLRFSCPSTGFVWFPPVSMFQYIIDNCCICLSVSPLRVMVYPVFPFLVDTRSFFQSFKLFLCNYDGVVTSKLLTWRSGNWKSSDSFCFMYFRTVLTGAMILTQRCHNKVITKWVDKTWTCWLKFWRLEIWNQGIGRAHLHKSYIGKMHPCFFLTSGANDWPFLVFSYTESTSVFAVEQWCSPLVSLSLRIAFFPDC